MGSALEAWERSLSTTLSSLRVDGDLHHQAELFVEARAEFVSAPEEAAHLRARSADLRKTLRPSIWNDLTALLDAQDPNSRLEVTDGASAPVGFRDPPAARPTLLPGRPGHIRVPLVMPKDGNRCGAIHSLYIHCERGSGSPNHRAGMRALFPALERVNQAFQKLQADACSGAAHVDIGHACFPALRDPVGNAKTHEDALSLELPMLLAALSNHVGSRPRSDALFATGEVDPETLRVIEVSDLFLKLTAIEDWLNRHPTPTALILIPRCHDLQRSPLYHGVAERLDSLRRRPGVRVKEVESVRQAWHEIEWVPLSIATGPARSERWIAALIAVWYFERFLGGEYLADPLTRHAVDGPLAALVMATAAVVPALTFYVIHVRWGHSANRMDRVLAWAWPFVAGLAVMTAFHLSGLFDGLPLTTPFLKHASPQTRIIWMWKDLVVVYPITLVMISFAWRVKAATRLTRHLRASGHLFGADRPVEAHAIGLLKFYPLVILVFMGVMAWMLAYDFHWYAEQPQKNWWIMGHMVFQSLFGLVVAFSIYFVEISTPDADHGR